MRRLEGGLSGTMLPWTLGIWEVRLESLWTIRGPLDLAEQLVHAHCSQYSLKSEHGVRALEEHVVVRRKKAAAPICFYACDEVLCQRVRTMF